MSDFNDCKSWPSYCVPFECYPVGEGPLRSIGSSYGECFSVVENDGPHDYTQSVRTDYSISICGNTLPIVKTTRDFSTHSEELFALPTGISGVYLTSEITQWCFDGFTNNQRIYRIKEDCKIERSTLHYIDMRYNMCLYRLNKEKIVFDLHSSRYSTFKTPWNMVYPGRVILYGGKEKNWNSVCTEEWHLIVNGVDRIIATTEYDPIPEMRGFASDGSDDLFDKTYPSKADKDVELILHPMPPVSKDTIPWDDELRYHGFYSYRLGVNSPNWLPDGGCGDYFYPAWCRTLQEDPFWKAAAKRRYDIVLDGDYQNKSDYVPPVTATVDPLPRGTFVKHPQVGEVWQFLVGKRNGTTHLETSPNVDELIKASLDKNGVSPVQGTMLYYPIGV